MDPLTHTLVGAALAATRLGQRTTLATPALVIGANLPDLDVLSYVHGSDAALGFRRGWTHGVPALIVLPALLVAILWLWNRRRPPDERAGFSPGRIAALSYLAVWTHPALDWLNTYGMRWWMPFSDTWYYGDSVFIMDPWLWLILGGFWLLSRRRSLRLAIGVAAFTAPLLLVVASRAPGFLPLAGVVIVALWLAAMVSPPSNPRLATALPAAGLVVGAAYIAALLLLHGLTVSRVRADLARQQIEVRELMVGPMPANPFRWDVVVGSGREYRYGAYDWLGDGTLALESRRLAAARPTSTWQEVIDSGQIPGFRRWTRFPWLEGSSDGELERGWVMDARYARRQTSGFGGAAFDLRPDDATP